MAHQPTPPKRMALLCASALAACAQLPPTVTDVPWQDQWGHRSQDVLARDYALCAELVEQRRSLLQGCMHARGWSTRTGDLAPPKAD